VILYYVIPGTLRGVAVLGMESKFFPTLEDAREYGQVHARSLSESFQEQGRVAILEIETGDLSSASLCEAINSEGCWWQSETLVETIKARRCGRCPGCISAFGVHRCKSPEMHIEPA
jgi:hypothetical protein